MRYRRIAAYGRLSVEERVYEMEIEALKSGADVVTDTVTGSMKEFPYTKHTITVQGKNTDDEQRIRDARKKMRRKLSDIRSEKRKIEAFIESIDDPVMKALIKKHVLEGKSWRAAADAVYGFGRMNDNTVRMSVIRWCDTH